MFHTTFEGKTMAFKSLGFSGKHMSYPLNSMFGMVVGEQNVGKSYLFQDNPDAFIFNLDVSGTVIPECKATIWPGIGEGGRPIDVDGDPLILTWERVKQKISQLNQLAVNDQPRPKCVVIDTMSPMYRLLEDWVVKQFNKEKWEQLDGRAAYKKLYDEIMNTCFDLRSNGYGVWLIVHLAKEKMEVEEQTRTELLLSLPPGLHKRLTPAVEMIAPIACDNVKTLKPRQIVTDLPNGRTHTRTVNDTTTTKVRKIAFSDTRFSSIIRTRTVNLMKDIELDGSPWIQFESAYNTANQEATK